MDWTEILKDALVPVLLALISATTVVVTQLLLKFKEWIVVKIGANNYNRAREVAIGLYTLLEDEFAHIEKAGAQKREEMNRMLLERFPSLTQVELDAINKEVWAMFNFIWEEVDVLGPVE